MNKILAADIGGTNIRAAVVNHDGNIDNEMRSHIELGDRTMSESQLIHLLVLFFEDMLKEYNDIKAIGAGFPGFFLGDSGLLVASPNLPNLHNVELAAKLSDKLNIPVHIQNDALCAAIGEHRFGVGKGSASLLHITLGTGIGGGLILNNTPYTGESGMAMEFGHLRVVHDDAARACSCGSKGCVEAYASATAISSQYYENTGVQTDSRAVFELAEGGDATASAIIEGAGHYLGMAIAEAVKLLDVHTITISGGPSGAWPFLYPTLVESLDSNLIPPLKGNVSILKSTLNDNAGLLGAASLAS